MVSGIYAEVDNMVLVQRIISNVQYQDAWWFKIHFGICEEQWTYSKHTHPFFTHVQCVGQSSYTIPIIPCIHQSSGSYFLSDFLSSLICSFFLDNMVFMFL